MVYISFIFVNHSSLVITLPLLSVYPSSPEHWKTNNIQIKAYQKKQKKANTTGLFRCEGAMALGPNTVYYVFCIWRLVEH